MMIGAAALALGACGGGGPEGGTSAANAAQYEGAIASSDTARGQQVYTDLCMACHEDGPTLEGIAWTPARLRQQVREGSGHMPPLNETRISADDLESVLAYMVTTGGAVGDQGGAAPADDGVDDSPEDPAPATEEGGGAEAVATGA